MGEYPTLYIGGLEIGMAALALAIGVAVAFAIVALASRVWAAPGPGRSAWLAAGCIVVAAGLWTIPLAALLSNRPGTVGQAGPFAWVAASLALTGAGLLLAATVLKRRRVAVPAGAGAGILFAGAAYAAARASGITATGVPDPLLLATAVAGAAGAAAAVVWVAIQSRAVLGLNGGWGRHTIATIAGVVLAAVPFAVIASMRAAPATASAPLAGATGSAGLLQAPASGLALTTSSVLWIAGTTLAALVAVISLAAAHRRALRRQAETEALRRSEDRFRSLVEASSQIVWTTAPDGQMADAQPSWSHFTGQEQPEYESWGWFAAIHPDDREATAGMWEEALANREPSELEHRVKRHDGVYRDCIVRVVPVLEENGEVREWIGTHTDVTDRARTSEDRDLLVEAGRVLSTSLDPRETLGALTGLIVPRLADWCTVETLAEDGGVQRILSVHADPHRAEILRDIETRFPTSADGGRGVAYVLRTEQSELIREVTEPLLRELAPDPAHRKLLVELGLTSRMCVPLTARGQVLGALTFAIADPVERYDLRDLALAEELARRAATAVDNARLHEQLQSAVRGRDDVLGIVSHDLRNPLHTIMMCTELLLDEEFSEQETRKHLDTVQRSAKAMNRLIQDLLDVSRSESGTLTVDRKSENPAEILEEACEAMRALADRRSVRLTCRAANGLAPVHADSARILQVLSNLVGNAVKFSSDGGSVTMSADAAEGAVVFTVSDEGPGIDPADIPHLFEPHWQAKSTAHLGAGLGLAISKGIVDAHGGRVWVESTLGKGSSFHFTVPLAGTAAAAREQSSDDGRARSSEPHVRMGGGAA